MSIESLTTRPDWFDVLIQRSTRFDGQPPFSDGSLVEFATGERTLLVIGDTAAALAKPGEAELVVDPDARHHGHGGELLDHLMAQNPAGLQVWAHGDHPAARGLAASRGLEPVRTLLQLRREEPAGRAVSTGSTRQGGGGMRAFTAGDADAWLDLNARAFAQHPEQGGVTRADLDVLLAEPWFRADDFLLLFDDADLVGYCWLKVEHGIGEFYVVGVSPDRQGQGLGRRLVDAGLSHLFGRGIHTASLYVEGDNLPALALYRSVGFVDYAVDVQYSTAGAQGATRSTAVHV